jgi:hypothetical protein
MADEQRGELRIDAIGTAVGAYERRTTELASQHALMRGGVGHP